MKKIWIMGGFGNILFQIIAYRVLEKDNEEVKFIDILTKKNIITKLLGWTIHERLFDTIISKNKIENINIFKSAIIILISSVSKYLKLKNHTAVFYNNYNRFEAPYSNNVFGYFQDKYFLEKNKSLIYQLGIELYNTYKQKESNIVVHYRMGDSDWARQYEKYYYQVRELIALENERVLIVTDSPKAALEFFSNCSNIQLTNAQCALEDFRCMVSAKKLYCAPSTFSWWAAHSMPKESEVIIPSFIQRQLGIYRANYTMI